MQQVLQSNLYRRRQTGAFDLIVIFALAFGVTAILIAIKILPIYIDHWSIEDSLTDVMHQAAASGKPSKKKVQRLLSNSLQINRIDFLTSKDLDFERTKTSLIAKLDYERRVPLMGNVDVVIRFPDTVVEATLGSE